MDSRSRLMGGFLRLMGLMAYGLQQWLQEWLLVEFRWFEVRGKWRAILPVVTSKGENS